MPPPRLSHSAEAARAAALQAEFNEKKWVWVPDDKDGYLAGWVVKEEGDVGEVVMAAGGEVRTLLHILRLILNSRPMTCADPQGPTIHAAQDESTEIRSCG